MDSLPRLQLLIHAATERDLATQVANVISNSWSANMRTPLEPEPAEYDGKSAKTLAEEDWEDVLLFFHEWEQQEGEEADASTEDSEEQPRYDPTQLDPSLAARRRRRREFSEALGALVKDVAEQGVQGFFGAVEAADEYEQLAPVYLNVLKRFFSLLRLLLLDGLK